MDTMGWVVMSMMIAGLLGILVIAADTEPTTNKSMYVPRLFLGIGIIVLTSTMFYAIGRQQGLKELGFKEVAKMVVTIEKIEEVKKKCGCPTCKKGEKTK